MVVAGVLAYPVFAAAATAADAIDLTGEWRGTTVCDELSDGRLSVFADTFPVLIRQRAGGRFTTLLRLSGGKADVIYEGIVQRVAGGGHEAIAVACGGDFRSREVVRLRPVLAGDREGLLNGERSSSATTSRARAARSPSVEAAEAAISNPLLDDVSLGGARAVLINITGGPDMTLFEVDAVATRIREEVDPDANIIFGSALDPAIGGRMRVSVVATGIPAPPSRGEARVEPRREPLTLARVAADPPPATRLRLVEPLAETPATAPPQRRATFLDRLRGQAPASSGTDARPEGGEEGAPQAVEVGGGDQVTPEELGDLPSFLRKR